MAPACFTRCLREHLRVAQIARREVRARLHRAHEVVSDFCAVHSTAERVHFAHSTLDHFHLFTPGTHR